MKSILEILTKGMEWEIREQCNWRFNALISQYKYLLEKKDRNLFFTFEKGWFDEKYNALFSLNSFFRIVIGPLASSVRISNSIGLGNQIPIQYGNSIKFDQYQNNIIRDTCEDYNVLIKELDFQEWWLTLNQASDIIYQIAKNIRKVERE
jgi:hypothetical protein